MVSYNPNYSNTNPNILKHRAHLRGSVSHSRSFTITSKKSAFKTNAKS